MPTLVFLGTSSGAPSKLRNVSSYALRMEDGKIILVDCGEGTQHQLIKCDDLKSGKIEAILITHLHGDHSFGLPGLLASLSLYGRTQPVKCVGPKGLKEYINSALNLSVTYLTYQLDVIELEPEKIANVGTLLSMKVTAFPLKHKVPSFGYLVEEPEKRGKLDANKAKELGITNPKDLGALTKGQSVTLPDGKVIQPSDVIGENRKGKKMLLLGDTCNSDSAIEGSQECDVVVHESTYDANSEQKALDGGHSTSIMAATFAKKINAKRLILTHFSSRYHGLHSDEPLTVADLVKEAQSEFGGKVEAADDFSKFDV